MGQDLPEVVAEPRYRLVQDVPDSCSVKFNSVGTGSLSGASKHQERCHALEGTPLAVVAVALSPRWWRRR